MSNPDLTDPSTWPEGVEPLAEWLADVYGAAEGMLAQEFNASEKDDEKTDREVEGFAAALAELVRRARAG